MIQKSPTMNDEYDKVVGSKSKRGFGIGVEGKRKRGGEDGTEPCLETKSTTRTETSRRARENFGGPVRSTVPTIK